MSLLAWFRPGLRRRVARARHLLGQGRLAEARAAVIDLAASDAEAAAIVAEAERELTLQGFEEAMKWSRLDGDEVARVRRSLAENWGKMR